MEISENQKNKTLLAVVSLITFLFVIGCIWGYNYYLDIRMNEVCHNLSMEYSYTEGNYFYCTSREPPFTLKEIRYR